MNISQYFWQQKDRCLNKLGIGKNKNDPVKEKYNLNYFQLAGRAEPIRLLFAVAEEEFKENNISSYDWKEVKDNILAKRFPLSEISTVEVNGTVIVESLDIFHFVANGLNLYGSNSDDKVVALQVIESINEMYNEMGIIRFNKTLDDGDKKIQYAEYIEDESTKVSLSYMIDLLNNSGNKFFMGYKVSAADIFYFCTMEFVTGIYPTALDGYPELMNHNKKVASLNVVKQYLSNRKQV